MSSPSPPPSIPVSRAVNTITEAAAGLAAQISRPGPSSAPDYINFATIISLHIDHAASFYNDADQDSLLRCLLVIFLESPQLLEPIGWDLLVELLNLVEHEMGDVGFSIPVKWESLRRLYRMIGKYGNARECWLMIGKSLGGLEFDPVQNNDSEDEEEALGDMKRISSQQKLILLLNTAGVIYPRIKSKRASRFLSDVLVHALRAYGRATANCVEEDLMLYTMAMVEFIETLHSGLTPPAPPLPPRDPRNTVTLAASMSDLTVSTSSAGGAANPRPKEPKPTEPDDYAIQVKLLQSFLTHITADHMRILGEFLESGAPALCLAARVHEKLLPDWIVEGAGRITDAFGDVPLFERRDIVAKRSNQLATRMGLTDQLLTDELMRNAQLKAELQENGHGSGELPVDSALGSGSLEGSAVETQAEPAETSIDAPETPEDIPLSINGCIQLLAINLAYQLFQKAESELDPQPGSSTLPKEDRSMWAFTHFMRLQNCELEGDPDPEKPYLAFEDAFVALGLMSLQRFRHANKKNQLKIPWIGLSLTSVNVKLLRLLANFVTRAGHEAIKAPAGTLLNSVIQSLGHLRTEKFIQQCFGLDPKITLLAVEWVKYLLLANPEEYQADIATQLLPTDAEGEAEPPISRDVACGRDVKSVIQFHHRIAAKLYILPNSLGFSTPSLKDAVRYARTEADFASSVANLISMASFAQARDTAPRQTIDETIDKIQARFVAQHSTFIVDCIAVLKKAESTRGSTAVGYEDENSALMRLEVCLMGFQSAQSAIEKLALRNRGGFQAG